MILQPTTKKELAAAFRAAGETYRAVTIHYQGTTYRFPVLRAPLACGYVPDKTWRPIAGWPQRDVDTRMDYRRYRCEHYARRAVRL